MSEVPDDLLGEAEAAQLLGVDRSTLTRWREKGDAPPYIQYESGTIRYSRRKVIEWREHYVVPPADVDGPKREGGRT